jgi:hypothetical protein
MDAPAFDLLCDRIVGNRRAPAATRLPMNPPGRNSAIRTPRAGGCRQVLHRPPAAIGRAPAGRSTYTTHHRMDGLASAGCIEVDRDG